MKSVKMNYLLLVCLSIFYTCCKKEKIIETKALQLTGSIALPNVVGRIDHFDFDAKNQILFLAELGNNTVEFIDLKNKIVLHRIDNLSNPQGVLFIPQTNTLVISNAGNAECGFYNAQTFQKITSFNLASDADNMRYDAVSKLIYIGYGDGAMAIIDAITFKIVGDVKLSGHPESFQIDKSSNKIYVNVPDNHQIEVVDLTAKSVTDIWKVTTAKSNYPMSLDEENHRLFVGCRSPAKLLILDTKTGKTISSFDIDSDVDDVYYDNKNKQIYLSCGGGYVNVFNQKDADTYIYDGKIASKTGARTSFLLSEIRQLIVASPSAIGREASLLIYDIKKQ